jgi:hypothetical protein
MDHCDICAETFTSCLRKKITCPEDTCKKSTCRVCIDRWMKYRTVISCPCCNTEWSYDFAHTEIGDAFMKRFVIIQRNVLFQQELGFMPHTQAFISENSERLARATEVYEHFYKMYKHYTKMRNRKHYDFVSDPLLIELGINTQAPYDITLYFLNERHHAEAEMKRLREMNMDKTTPIRRESPVCPCPSSDCRGYIRSQNYQCGMCETKICHECHCQLNIGDNDNDNTHKCDPAHVASVKTIHRESKPCPKCGTRIQKSEGCAQMYCIQCKTAFDYRTGEIEHGRIHNPHYYEELRRLANGGEIRREIGDQCNDQELPVLPWNYVVSRNFRSFIDEKSRVHKIKECIDKMDEFISYYAKSRREHVHNEEHRGDNEIAHFTNDRIDQLNHKERIRYLKKEISEETFKRYLYKNMRRNEMNKELVNELFPFFEATKTVLFSMWDIIKIFIDDNTYILFNNLSDAQIVFEYYRAINQLEKYREFIETNKKMCFENIKKIYEIYNERFVKTFILE